MSDVDIRTLTCRCKDSNYLTWQVFSWPETRPKWDALSGMSFGKTGYDNFVVRCPVCQWSHFLGRYISEEKQSQINSDLQYIIDLMQKGKRGNRDSVRAGSRKRGDK